jgi:hypothetical protein
VRPDDYEAPTLTTKPLISEAEPEEEGDDEPVRDIVDVPLPDVIDAAPVLNSDERTEDVVFQNLIRRWTKAREWDWVMAANVMYGHVLDQRERTADGAW